MLNRITKVLLLIIVAELVLGGGGRLVSLGPVSLRMMLFAMAMILTGVHFLKGRKLDRGYLTLLLVFTTMILIGSFIGIISGAEKKLIWEDVKPLLFFFLLPFLVLAINEKEDLKCIHKSIVITSVSMAIIFLLTVTLLNTNQIPFLKFYKVTLSTEEFFYRGEYTFFYKGFVYFCIGFLIVHIQNKKNNWWVLLLLGTAILLTFTRGLLFALSLTYLTYFLFQKKYRSATLMILLSCSILFFGKDIYASISNSLYKIDTQEQLRVRQSLSSTLLGDREYSDNERKRQIVSVLESITPGSMLWGHGFGNGTKHRPVHMEITYLEIFHKQGLIGVACWCFFFLFLVQKFRYAFKYDKPLSLAFFLSALFFFFQSLTNQYINNPIGLGMFMISLISLDVVKKSGEQKVI